MYIYLVYSVLGTNSLKIIYIQLRERSLIKCLVVYRFSWGEPSMERWGSEGSYCIVRQRPSPSLVSSDPALASGIPFSQRYRCSVMDAPCICVYSCRRKLALEAEAGVEKFKFSRTDPDLVVGGLENGRCVLWDLDGKWKNAKTSSSSPLQSSSTSSSPEAR